jgi:GT2 family glycosyltransferase
MYRLLDVEVTRPLPRVTLEAHEAGLAVLVRRDGRPLSFFMEEVAAGASFGADEIGALIARWSAQAILEETIRRQLAGPPSDSPPAHVTIAVCTRDRVDHLETCLASILALTPAHEQREGFEILVVDNAPSDSQTESFVASLPRVRYVCEPKPGLDFARNRALAEAREDFVAFVDDDTVVDRGWLAGLDEAIHENPDAAAVTGAVLPYELETEAQIVFERRGGFRRGFEKLRYQGPTLPGNPLYPVGAGLFGAGANMVVRKELASQLGGFDEALDTGPPLPGGGDLDIFYRVVRAGHPLVYEPRMLVFHKHRRELAALRRQYWTWGTGFMAFVAKTYAADLSQRNKLRHLIRWWLLGQLRHLKGSLRPETPLTPRLVLAEFIGGVVGLLGTYGRSRRRSRAIRRRFE